MVHATSEEYRDDKQQLDNLVEDARKHCSKLWHAGLLNDNKKFTVLVPPKVWAMILVSIPPGQYKMSTINDKYLNTIQYGGFEIRVDTKIDSISYLTGPKI